MIKVQHTKMDDDEAKEREEAAAEVTDPNYLLGAMDADAEGDADADADADDPDTDADSSAAGRLLLLRRFFLFFSPSGATTIGPALASPSTGYSLVCENGNPPPTPGESAAYGESGECSAGTCGCARCA